MLAAALHRGVGLCETGCWREIPFTMSSRSDSASSRLTICAFSHLSGFLGLAARAFTMIASTTRKLATPTNTIVVIDSTPLSSGCSKQLFSTELCACRSCGRYVTKVAVLKQECGQVGFLSQ